MPDVFLFFPNLFFIDAFIEELLVRRELSHNFVYYAMDNYDKVSLALIFNLI